ncbi:hypothetical protein ACHAWF_017209 [Thalassiosira exigua]
MARLPSAAVAGVYTAWYLTLFWNKGSSIVTLRNTADYGVVQSLGLDDFRSDGATFGQDPGQNIWPYRIRRFSPEQRAAGGAWLQVAYRSANASLNLGIASKRSRLKAYDTTLRVLCVSRAACVA